VESVAGAGGHELTDRRPLCVMFGRMPCRRPVGSRSRHAVALSAAIAISVLALLLSGCQAAGPGPVPGPVTSPGPLQLSRFGSGSARVQVTGAAQGTFDFALVPSSISMSPPALLDLAYGKPVTGEGLTLQLPP